MTLRELLKRDFEFDLSISGGFGQSRDDPITLATPNATDAALTEMLVLRCLGVGRNILWKTVVRTPLEHNGALLEQVKIETKEVNESEIITQIENYYFDVSAVTLNVGQLPVAIAYMDAETGLPLPFEIGWLHFKSILDNEPNAKGLGRTMTYGAPGIKASVYVYSGRSRHTDTDSETGLIKDELRKALTDILLLHPNAKALGVLMDSGNLMSQKLEIDGELSTVALAFREGKFVKLRLTFINDPLLIELAEQSVMAFKNILMRRNENVKGSSNLQ